MFDQEPTVTAEPYSDEWYTQVHAHQEWKVRGQVKAFGGPALVERYDAWLKARKDLDDARKALTSAHIAYGDTLADFVGLKRGCFVTAPWGNNQTRRYRVTDWEASATYLTLKGVIIKQDGTEGEVHTIGTNWRFAL